MDSDTVIGAFVLGVCGALAEAGSEGAAARVLSSGTTLEPIGRAESHEEEERRLLLLGDQALHSWVPRSCRTLLDPSLDHMVEHLPRVDSSTSARQAAEIVGSIRDRLDPMPEGALASKPPKVAAALVGVQRLLQHLSRGESMIERRNVAERAGRTLAACFDAGASFPNGIQGEVRETVYRLDALDPTATVPLGTRPLERVSHESDKHRTLVSSLVSWLALNVGTVAYADGVGRLQAPPKVGRHHPDAAGRTADGLVFIGEAKLGPELFETHSIEQLEDFLTWAEAADSRLVVLFVPAEWRSRAEAAAAQAYGNSDRLRVVTLGGTGFRGPD